MAPTICSEKNTQKRSGIKDVRKESNIISLPTGHSSNYGQKRSKVIRPYPAIGKRHSDNSVNHISSSSDASNDIYERLHHPNSPTSSSFADNLISTSSESSHVSPMSLSAFPSPSISHGDCTPCTNPLKPFHHSAELSSVYTISSSDEEKNIDDDMISRSFSVIASDNQDTVTSTIENEKTNFRSLSKLQQIQQQTKHTKGLFEIAIKMIKLVHRNQLLQRRLSQLQSETSQFIQSVLANPENQAFRDKVQVQSKN